LKRGKKRKTKSVLLSDKQLCDAAKKMSGVIDACIICPADIETAEWVKLKCWFGCDGYGQCLVCPPYTPSAEQMRKVLDCYNRAILIHFAPGAEPRIKAIVFELERSIFLQGAWKALGLGAGPCYFCEECPVEEGHCLQSERARPSMEACGIDVFTTVRKAGYPIEVVRTRRQYPNYYGLILVD